jgi:L-rhamnose isomerase
LGKDILVGDDAGKFEVTIGEVTTGIASIGNKAGLDMRGEWGTP